MKRIMIFWGVISVILLVLTSIPYKLPKETIEYEVEQKMNKYRERTRNSESGSWEKYLPEEVVEEAKEESMKDYERMIRASYEPSESFLERLLKRTIIFLGVLVLIWGASIIKGHERSL